MCALRRARKLGPAGIGPLLGIGFGPSNLALAVAIDEHNRGKKGDERLNSTFFEKQSAFGWHRGRLIEGTTMRVSYLKDLVAMRNPASDFSFLSYLRDKGRLVDFINHKTFFPTRVENHDYMSWAANRLDELVHYDSEVVEVVPVRDGARVEHFDVVVRWEGELTTYRPATSWSRSASKPASRRASASATGCGTTSN